MLPIYVAVFRPLMA